MLGELGNVTEEDVAAAIESARKAAPGWRALSYDDRAAIFLKAAELLAGPWRATINAATILGHRVPHEFRHEVRRLGVARRSVQEATYMNTIPSDISTCPECQSRR